jgi:ribosomal protein S18 acetylase RimI-like enzyme
MADVELVRAGPESIDDFEPLWLQLRAHHASLEPDLGIQPRPVSWALRRKLYQAWLGQPDSFAITARKGGSLVGYAVVVVHAGPDDTWVTGDRIAEVESLCVASQERRTGLGSAILDFVDAELASIGVEDIQIGVVAANADAIRFYRRRGLRPWLTIMSRFPAAERAGRDARSPGGAEPSGRSGDGTEETDRSGDGAGATNRPGDRAGPTDGDAQ